MQQAITSQVRLSHSGFSFATRQVLQLESSVKSRFAEQARVETHTARARISQHNTS